MGAQQPFLQVLSAPTMKGLICAPGEMGEVRERDYFKKMSNYGDMRLHYSIEDMVECGPMVFGNQEK